ncbi:MAG: hypothetical protein J0I82_03305 [Spirosoma sp.]|uniref:hypothetical protein n=1 Tax=Spirosoma sp. TaxID=1899569 RepID=UPI001AC71685|nr:hypothetical protein [Spirosoma sp.]MBN8821026.1 hypothetical protein [Spirosoma sp.]
MADLIPAHLPQREVPRQGFLARYRRLLQTSPPGQITLRQLYSAGAYHVVVCLMTSSETTYPI